LTAPVVSVGNLAMGGRGKTPVVALVARLLVEAGERPAILSRGYRRADPQDGVVIVSDGTHRRADLGRAGDEPLMLARAVPGAAVLVCEVRAMAAALAEVVLAATVHVLDDGFQHRSLERDIDIVIVSPADLRDRRLPFGRLRSPVAALRHADAVVVDGASAADVTGDLAAAIGTPAMPVLTMVRRLGEPWWVDAAGRGDALPARDEPIVAVAGIAAPDRFRTALDAAGWRVADLVAFPDHHAYGARDLRRIVDAAAGRPVLTTEKDAMRLLPLRPLPVPVAAVPLLVDIEPPDVFRDWLLGRLAGVRA